MHNLTFWFSRAPFLLPWLLWLTVPVSWAQSSDSYDAGGSYQSLGGDIYTPGGATDQQNGNQIQSDSGTTYQTEGNLTLGTDGSEYQTTGDTTYNFNGTSCLNSGSAINCD